MKKRRLTQFKGFTLIEIIATIAIAGIIMIMILPFFQSGITNSHLPAQWLQEAVNLERTMENMNNRYRGLLLDTVNPPAQDLQTLAGEIGTGPQTNGFGNYTVLENGAIIFNCVGNVCTETPDNVCTPGVDCRVVKVTIRNNTIAQGYQLTQLFTVQ